ncbi:hypothetical protein A2U01_0110633, partial [Trifolium medium]|nr:hypothetical protein [Trifolium medium]
MDGLSESCAARSRCCAARRVCVCCGGLLSDLCAAHNCLFCFPVLFLIAAPGAGGAALGAVH